MATYFLNAAGSDTFPFDTEAKGAPNFGALKTGLDNEGAWPFSENTVIEVSSLGGALDCTGEGLIDISAEFSVTVRSYASNSVKPVLTLNGTDRFQFVGIAESQKSVTITGIVFNYVTSGNIDILFTKWTADSIIDSCEFYTNENILRTFIRISGGDNTKIVNCIIKGKFSQPIIIGTSASGVYPSNTKIVNNTIVAVGFIDPEDGVTETCATPIVSGNSASNRYVNNIIEATLYGGEGISDAVDSQAINNDLFGCITPLTTVQDVNNIFVNPLFISASDLQVQPGSPCRSYGIGPSLNASVPVQDILGITRSGNNTDIGAYQSELSPTPVAVFSADSISGRVPFTVTFTDRSTNTPTSWAWDFGDGTSSTIQNPSHVYNTPGIFTIGLTATNAGGSDGEIKIDYIIVVDKNPGDTKNPDDIVGMPGASDTATGSNLRDTQLGTGPGNSGNTLEKNGSKKTQNRDDQFGSSYGARQRNNENTNGVKSLLPRIQELARLSLHFSTELDKT
jgi:hypothetical protein